MAFFIMLIPLAIAGMLSFVTTLTYLPDAAAVMEYRQKTMDNNEK
jgi:hypothetical protein